jgi:hypothetical protein
MIEYPSIINSSKAPRDKMVAFDKLDGSNFRAKYTSKKGFETFGTRTQLIDETTPFWGNAVNLFINTIEQPLLDKFTKDKEFRHEREIIVFGEYLGPNSFAGRHQDDDPMEIVVFDIMVGHKNRKFLSPHTFVKEFKTIVKIPTIVFEGNLSDDFINRVRENEFNLNEGVICKGLVSNGAYRGNVWMCKIKTNRYFEMLKEKFGEDEYKLYWE